MKVAEYPERMCRQPVIKGFATYTCPIPEHHPGPCAAFEDPESVKRRDQWEAANPGWEKLSSFADPFEEIRP